MFTLNETKTVYDLLNNAQNEYAERVFVRYEKDDIIYEKSYRIFATDSMAIAAWTQEKEKEQKTKVHAALIGKASYGYLTVMIGVMAAGSVVVPMDVQLSTEGLADQINRSDSNVVFYDWDFHVELDLLRELCPGVKEFICIQNRKGIDNIVQIDKTYRNRDVENYSKEEDLAAIIFTSGTTGRSKGVMLSQGNLIDNVFNNTEESEYGEVSLNVLPIHHVFCLNGNVFLIMRYGSTICLCDDLSKLLYYIQLFQPGMIRLVPMMAKMLYNRYLIHKKQHPEWSEEELKASVFGKRLRRMAVGGAYLSDALAKNLCDLGFDVGQGYGMSECSPKISTPDYNRLEKIASVGQIVERCEVRIVDGEVQVKSPSVMMGYYKEPELTKEVLSEDGWLATGDLGYVDEDNFLYLTGRKKNLIILSNGENVSPEQIENHFEDDALIADILVYAAEETIEAEVYPNYEYAQVHHIKNIEEEVKKIIALRNEELTTYQKISDCHIRKHPFEKTSSKKLIRPTYFAKKEEKKKRVESVRKPENQVQQEIYDIVSSVMGEGVFGIDDNLYQCGLDSLGSILLIEELLEHFKKNINLTELLENNTVEKLEQFFSSEQAILNVDYSVREVYPLTNMMKYFGYIIKGNTTGNLPFTFELSKSVDLERLRNAIITVINAHPGLKGVIKPMESGYYGLYRDDEREIDIPIIKLTEKEWKQKVKTLLVPFAYTAEDNLFHISLYETRKAKYMFFDVAHIMGDGISMNVLMEDLNRAYAGEAIEKEGYSIYEYVLEEQSREETGVRQRDLAYIDELLDGLRLNRSILNRKEMEEYSPACNAVVRKRFDRLVRKKLLYFCHKNGVSENVLFLTAFNYAISLFSDEADIFSNSIHGGRTDSRWSRLVGPLFLTYYCRYTRTPHETVVDLLKKTGQQIMTTMKCSVATQRQGEMFFQYQGDILNVPEIGGYEAKRISQQLDSLPFHMQVMSDDDGYYMELRYWNNRFDKKLVEIFLTCYEEILAAIPTEPSARRLKKHISEEMYPKHFSVTVSKMNQAGGENFFPDLNGNNKVNVYVLDEQRNKKPYGAWGRLYVRETKPAGDCDEYESPYRPGTLYDMGKTARLMPDGSIDFLEVAGKTVLTEGMRGRKYYDLKLLKDTLLSLDEIEKAETYLVYNKENNGMRLVAEITANQTIDENALKEMVKGRIGEGLIPDTILVK